MKTTHKIFYQNSKRMDSIPSNSVDLIVTSPPYPMIEMWDEMFCKQNTEIKNALSKNNGQKAYELMHNELDSIWDECYRVLKEGGIACINIGDATRTIDGEFCLYSNHSRIQQYFIRLGFRSLPDILWRKQTNAPNKFMGSGMLPAGAYVTLEHEFILIFRKGSKREFKTIEEKKIRKESAFFWEERNVWFSDIWMDIKGTAQKMADKNSRKRSGAYPVEVAYRLINMFSVKGDVVLDPFLGTGTTAVSAIALGRNSVGFEIDSSLCDVFSSFKNSIIQFSNDCIRVRLLKHLEFVENRIKTHGALKHSNKHYGFPVMTQQEKELLFNNLESIKETDNIIEVSYSSLPQEDFIKNYSLNLERKKPLATDYPQLRLSSSNMDSLQLKLHD